jgi:hypothetical protein
MISGAFSFIPTDTRRKSIARVLSRATAIMKAEPQNPAF